MYCLKFCVFFLILYSSKHQRKWSTLSAIPSVQKALEILFRLKLFRSLTSFCLRFVDEQTKIPRRRLLLLYPRNHTFRASIAYMTNL